MTYTAQSHEVPAPRRRITLSRMILAGFLVGCLVGWLAPNLATSLKPISDLFLRLIRMVLAPLLITTLVGGIAGAGAKMVGRLAIKALLWFELATTAALFIGLAVANLVRPGRGVSGIVEPAAHGALAKPKTAIEFLLNVVPTSIFDAMSRNDVVQIVAFSVLFGLAVTAAGERGKLVKDIADAGAEVVFKLVGFVMWVAPFAVFAAIASTLGANGIDVMLPLVKCVGALYGALIVFFGLLFGAMVLVARVHLPSFLAAIREPAVIAFTTATSDAAMPRAIQALEQLGVPRRIVGFVVPTGYAFNLDGSTLYLSLAVMFVSQLAGIELSWSTQLQIMLVLMVSSKGVAGVPRAALVVLGAVVGDFGLPGGGLVLLLGIDAVMDMGRTCVNVVGNCVATVVVAAWERAIPSDAPIFGPRASPPRS